MKRIFGFMLAVMMTFVSVQALAEESYIIIHVEEDTDCDGEWGGDNTGISDVEVTLISKSDPARTFTARTDKWGEAVFSVEPMGYKDDNDYWMEDFRVKIGDIPAKTDDVNYGYHERISPIFIKGEYPLEGETNEEIKEFDISVVEGDAVDAAFLQYIYTAPLEIFVFEDADADGQFTSTDQGGADKEIHISNLYVSNRHWATEYYIDTPVCVGSYKVVFDTEWEDGYSYIRTTPNSLQNGTLSITANDLKFINGKYCFYIPIGYKKIKIEPTPTPEPTATPTPEPTATPTPEPTATPTPEPTATPTPEPTATPTPEPTATPTPEPTATPTAEPTATPTAEPTATPTAEPTATPTAEPTATPTAEPTATPTPEPTATPTAEPMATPTAEPTTTPTAEPTATPTPEPTATPSPEPTAAPTVEPTATPTAEPTATPTPEPTAIPDLVYDNGMVSLNLNADKVTVIFAKYDNGRLVNVSTAEASGTDTLACNGMRAGDKILVWKSLADLEPIAYMVIK